MKTAFTQWIKTQIYILFYETEKNYTLLKPVRVAITNINIVLDDDLSPEAKWGLCTSELVKHYR